MISDRRASGGRGTLSVEFGDSTTMSSSAASGGGGSDGIGDDDGMLGDSAMVERRRCCGGAVARGGGGKSTRRNWLSKAASSAWLSSATRTSCDAAQLVHMPPPLARTFGKDGESSMSSVGVSGTTASTSSSSSGGRSARCGVRVSCAVRRCWTLSTTMSSEREVRCSLACVVVIDSSRDLRRAKRNASRF